MSVVHRLTEQARLHPHATAILTADGRSLSYDALMAHAQHVAHRLVEHGVGPGDVTGLYLDPSPEYVVGLLATWLVGAAFVPLDPGLPEGRLAHYLAQANPALIMYRVGQRPRVGRRADAIDLTGTPCRRVSLSAMSPDDVAYIIFTSGSTGAPKGVCVAHRGLVPMLDAQIDAFELGPDSRTLWVLSPQFDASISDLGTILLAGGTLCIPHAPMGAHPRLLEASLAHFRVTAVDLPPSLLPHLSLDALPDCLRTVIIGGEVCAPAVARRWAERVRLINVYGPTEATVCTSLGRIDPQTWGAPLLGQPLPGIEYRLQAEDGQPTAVGELHISGPCVALGYLGQPKLTAQRFGKHGGQPSFATGDRVRRRADGEWVFEGRIDRQLKLAGRLVAPEEIEAALVNLDGVHCAVVKGHEGDALHAFVESTRDPATLRDALAQSLPSWMVPTQIIVMGTLPRTATGKPDVNALRPPPAPRASMAAPTGNRITDLLVGLWSRALGYPAEPDTDYFTAGGTSLGALRILAGAHAAGLDITLDALIAQPSPAALADVICLDGVRSVEALRRDAKRHLGQLPPRTLGATPKAPRQLLVTGATGALGRRLLPQLLDDTRVQITALVRAADGDAALQRLRHALPAGIPWARVRVIAGDLGAPQLGLAPQQWGTLAANVGGIVHCGALLSLAANYDALAPVNLGGTATLLALANTARPKRLDLVSSLSVFVDSTQSTGRFAETTPLANTGGVHGGYAQTKWAAEALATAAREHQSINIYRLGLLTGAHLSGLGLEDAWLGRFIRGLARFGAIPGDLDPTLSFDVTPIDYAARALSQLILRPIKGDGETFHLCGPRAASLADLIKALEKQRGPIERLERAVFDARIQGALAQPDGVKFAPFALGLSRAHRHRALDLFRATNATFDTRVAHQSLGFSAPAVSQALLTAYVTAALAYQETA